MDAKTYERVREEFLRVHELPKPELEAALEQLDRDEPEIAVELRKLLAGTTNGGSQDPGFEDAIHRGLAGGAQELIPTLRLSSGTEVGPFSIESYINDGGFGEVYLARQDDPNREVALKIIKPGMDSAQVIRRFRQEREALAKMNHPSVAGFYQAGSTPAELGSRPYFAMEFVHGATITEYCIRQNLMIEARIKLFVEVCAAVQHAHSKGVIHRDLKPSNVLIAEMDGKAVPKVIDFGIAKALDHRLGQMSVNTVEGQFLGTPAYMSPEQAGGGDIDTRTDVYALGVMLYELLTNALPFDSRTLADLSLAELQRVIRESTPTRPSQKVKDAGQKAASESRARVAMARRLQPDLDDIIMQCLEKEPKDRYPTASALAEDLQRFLEGKPVEAVRAHGLYRTKKWVQRHKLVVSITAAVTLLVFTSLTTAVISFALKLDESRKLVDTTKTLEQVQVELEDSQQERDSNAQEAGRLAAEVAGSLADLESMTAQRNEAQREIDDTKAQFEASQAELARLTDAVDRTADDLGRARAEAAAQQQEFDRQRREQQDLFDQVQQELASQEAARRADIEALNQTVAQVEQQIEEKQEELRSTQRLYLEAQRAIEQMAERNRSDEGKMEEWAYSDDTQGPIRVEFLEQLVESALAKPEMPQAIKHQSQLVTVSIGLHGSDDVKTLTRRLELVQLKLLVSNLAGAEEELGRVIAAADRSPESAEAIRSDLLLAQARLALEHWSLDAALDFATRAVELRTARFGAFDHRTSEAIFVRALIHMKAGRNELAIQDYQYVIRLDDAQFGPDTREFLAMACHNLAYLERRRGSGSLSAVLLVRANDAAVAAWGARDWRTAIVSAHHGYALSLEGDFVTAEAKLKTAEGVLWSSLGPDHAQTRALRRGLVQFYTSRYDAEGTRKYDDEVATWQAKLGSELSQF